MLMTNELRNNGLQVWSVAEHLANVPAVRM